MIIVGVDFSANSAAAVRWAQARGTGPVRLVYAAQPTADLVRHTAEVTARLGEDRRRLSQWATDSTPGPVELIVEPGHPAEVLLNQAAGAALLVVGRRGASGLDALLAGSVSRKIARTATLPVAVIPPLCAGGPTRRVVVGVDGSETAYHALRWAHDEATRLDVPLKVVYAVPVLYWPQPLGIGPDPGAVEPREGSGLVTDALDKLAADMGHPVEAERVVEFGTPAQLLIDNTRTDDLLVVGVRGHSALAGLVLGSTAEQCLSRAPCPVIVIPKTGG